MTITDTCLQEMKAVSKCFSMSLKDLRAVLIGKLMRRSCFYDIVHGSQAAVKSRPRFNMLH